MEEAPLMDLAFLALAHLLKIDEAQSLNLDDEMR